MRNRTKEYEALKMQRKIWHLSGQCRQCGDKEIVKSHFCEKCYLIRVSAKRLGSGKYWRELKELLENQKIKSLNFFQIIFHISFNNKRKHNVKII